MSVTKTIEELAVVELTRDVERFPTGSVGTVVSAHPEQDLYTVEITDGNGTTLDLLPCRREDLRLANHA
jgi:hypothetical protein